jgi:hypothetical protein
MLPTAMIQDGEKISLHRLPTELEVDAPRFWSSRLSDRDANLAAQKC